MLRFGIYYYLYKTKNKFVINIKKLQIMINNLNQIQIIFANLGFMKSLKK